MAKKAARKNAGAELAVTNTEQLTGDGANPRKISEEAAAGLSSSLEKFGDLSGIVYNLQTQELVTGHQRMEQIRERWGDVEVKKLDVEHGIGCIAIDSEHYFPVRLVDWSPGKQRAANVAANNAKISGKFTSELSTYLLEFEAEISEELPGVFDSCLLTELMAAGLDTSDASESEESGVEIKESYQVVVECKDQADQEAIHQELTEKGYSCKVLTV